MDRAIEILARLLDVGRRLKGWDGEVGLLTSAEFGEYWSLLWQLQVAALCHQRGFSASWMPGGPDLCVLDNTSTFFVECYSYRKKFGVENFVEEIFKQMDSSIEVKHRLAVPLKTPEGIEDFLDRLFTPYLEPDLLMAAKIEAQGQYEVCLPVPADTQNLRVTLKGQGEYWPSLKALEEMDSGDPEAYLSVAVGEVLSAKTSERREKQLSGYRPNLLAANLALSPDFQASLHRRRQLNQSFPTLLLPTAVDAVALAACGIDQPCARFLHACFRTDDHPAISLVGP